jgi:hypothetical protein
MLHQQIRQHLSEGLLQGDLEYLVDDSIHLDEFNSKMGQPQDVITLSFKIKDYMPAQDLVNFLESGYDYVLDADISSGEIADNERLVFVEMERSPDNYKQISEILSDLDHLTGIKPAEWRFRWFKQNTYQQFTEESFKELVPQTPEDYEASVKNFLRIKQESSKLNADLDNIKKLSGIA